ncbi:MAG: methyltransferase, partial [Verrucomicrobia bacterium RIFCSPHIGHO2_12_FULL_41_10]
MTATHSSVRDYFKMIYGSKKVVQHEWTAGTASPELIRVIWENQIALGSRVLEVGCGVGTESVFLAVRGMCVSAIDISSHAIEKAKMLAAAYDVMVDFQVADALHLPFENQTFDVFCDQGCFHHLTDEERITYVSELMRVLKPGGMFLLRSFSDKMPPGPQPRRITSRDLISTFSPHLELEHMERVLSFSTPQRPSPIGWSTIWV